jgi:hypothetical protein
LKFMILSAIRSVSFCKTNFKFGFPIYLFIQDKFMSFKSAFRTWLSIWGGG